MKKPQQKQVRPTQAQRREESAQRLFDAAFRLISQGGVRSLSLAAIAKEAGCSRELPRYHYGSKDNFLAALLDDTQRAFGERLAYPREQGLVGVDAIMTLFDSLHGFFADPHNIRGRLLLINELASSENPMLRRKTNAVHAATRAQLVKIMEEGIAAGELAQVGDLAAFAALLHGTYRGIGMQWVHDPKSIDIEAVLGQIRGIYLRMLVPPKRRP